MEHDKNSAAPHVTVCLECRDPEYRGDIRLSCKGQTQQTCTSEANPSNTIKVPTLFNNSDSWRFEKPVRIKWKDKVLMSFECEGRVGKDATNLMLTLASDGTQFTTSNIIKKSSPNETLAHLSLLITLGVGALSKFDTRWDAPWFDVMSPFFNVNHISTPPLASGPTKINMDKVDVGWMKIAMRS